MSTEHADATSRLDVDALDNPNWFGLTGAQQGFAEGSGGLARRFRPEISVFGAIAEEITKAKPKITAAMTMATARLPFFSSSHSSTGVSQVKTDSKIQSERAMVKIPTAPQPMSFR